jgi:hypothetical protein
MPDDMMTSGAIMSNEGTLSRGAIGSLWQREVFAGSLIKRCNLPFPSLVFSLAPKLFGRIRPLLRDSARAASIIVSTTLNSHLFYYHREGYGTCRDQWDSRL